MYNSNCKIIFLIGMMGSGKTSVGFHLSRLLGFTHIDTDDMITIPHIMTSENEKRLRENEYKTLINISSISDSKAYIISTGGGIVLNPKCREILQQYYNIYLKAPINTLKKRILKQNIIRPILNNTNGNFDDLQFQLLMRKREKFYNRIANQTIDTTKLNVNDSAKKLKKMLLKNEIIS